jgi:hypothetical protein
VIGRVTKDLMSLDHLVEARHQMGHRLVGRSFLTRHSATRFQAMPKRVRD